MLMSQEQMDQIRFKLESLREALLQKRLTEPAVQSLMEEISMLRSSGHSGRFDGTLAMIETLLMGVRSNLQATSWIRTLGA
ncbi:MAG: hypothetical protein ACI8QZ_002832 [Chlamydiales bacterium]|jgi:hypothetical protein